MMTRVCSNVHRPNSPKSKCNGVGSQALKLHEGGVNKRQGSQAKGLKAMSKSLSKSDMFAQLKNLLPNAKHEETTSEIALVEETIAYIAHLESLLSTGNCEDPSLCSAVDMLKNMAV